MGHAENATTDDLLARIADWARRRSRRACAPVDGGLRTMPPVRRSATMAPDDVRRRRRTPGRPVASRRRSPTRRSAAPPLPRCVAGGGAARWPRGSAPVALLVAVAVVQALLVARLGARHRLARPERRRSCSARWPRAAPTPPSSHWPHSGYAPVLGVLGAGHAADVRPPAHPRRGRAPGWSSRWPTSPCCVVAVIALAALLVAAARAARHARRTRRRRRCVAAIGAGAGRRPPRRRGAPGAPASTRPSTAGCPRCSASAASAPLSGCSACARLHRLRRRPAAVRRRRGRRGRLPALDRRRRSCCAASPTAVPAWPTAASGSAPALRPLGCRRRERSAVRVAVRT